MVDLEEERLNLHQKLAKIRKIADHVGKEKKGFGYSYSDISEILAKVKAGMDKYGVSLIPEFVHGTATVQNLEIRTAKLDKQGKTVERVSHESLITSDMIYRWVNDENPTDNIMVPWFLAAQMEDAAQAEGAGLTYGMRQFLTNYFQIAQDNDVDTYRSRQKEAEKTEDRLIASSIIEALDKNVHDYLANGGDREAVLKFMKKYTKDGNYKSIQDPVVAQKLLQDFENKFMNAKTEEGSN